ncbi:hypothetical protein ALC53_08358 [Atta colombica]|uniref:Uncharacterized protein n=1 Tax=Atta colombica TaxID=520822 RepID=A0A195BAM8_9HYME|nr:hypothetical protein ALC53_08358 [Atta colombica]
MSLAYQSESTALGTRWNNLPVPRGSRFTSFAEIENWLQNWIASKDESFFRDGIRKLPER